MKPARGSCRVEVSGDEASGVMSRICKQTVPEMIILLMSKMLL